MAGKESTKTSGRKTTESKTKPAAKPNGANARAKEDKHPAGRTSTAGKAAEKASPAKEKTAAANLNSAAETTVPVRTGEVEPLGVDASSEPIITEDGLLAPLFDTSANPTHQKDGGQFEEGKTGWS